MSRNEYHYVRVVEINGRVVRSRVKRDSYLAQSHAVTEVLTDQMTWTNLAVDDPGNWWQGTPLPYNQDVDAATVLGPVADRLLDRAATILANMPHRCPHCSAPTTR